MTTTLDTLDTLHRRTDEQPLLLSLPCANPAGAVPDALDGIGAGGATNAAIEAPAETPMDMPAASPADTVFVVAQDERHRARFRRVCASLGRACLVASVADVIVHAPRPGPAQLAIVAANGLDVPLGAVLEALRDAGVSSVALYGPTFGSLVHLLALELGFDHVWGDLAHEEALAVLIRHAGQRIHKGRVARADDAMGDTGLTVDTASLTCNVRGVPFALGISSLYTLKLLLDRAPHPVSRADIETVIPATKAGRIGGTRVVDAHVSRLRQRLREVGADAVRIVAIRGKGYRLTTTATSDGEDGEID
ncbi:Transcriptional regulatory protein, C terminal [Rhizobacter sp. OV335]|nr:Transcriptional regulatory protein, C terminal [Rhizobacter sp. OV335]